MENGFRLDEGTVRRVLETALAAGADYAEVYGEGTATTVISVEDGRVERVKTGTDTGAGVRVVSGESSSYVYTDDVTLTSLLEAARLAAAAARNGPAGVLPPFSPAGLPPLHRVKERPEAYAAAGKVDLVLRAEKSARSVDPLIRQVTASYADTVKRIYIANSAGLWTEEERVYVRLSVEAVAARNGEIQTGTHRIARQTGMEVFEAVSPEHVGQAAGRQAITNLFARPAPSGRMPVVISNGWGGVLFHEACGHGLEADAVQKRSSVFAGRTGQRVASDAVTAFDDATVPNSWGSFVADDEGQPGTCTLLIERGILQGYMYDRKTARREGRSHSGNGRRQSYHHLPLPRMSNTYIAAGEAKPADVIAETRAGLFAKDLRGGQVNTATGDFVFTVSEGYLIRDGRLAEPVRGATLIGNGPEVLMKIDLVADDLELAPGMCGKDGQQVPTACGQPTLRITELTVGGTTRDPARKKPAARR